MQTRDQRRSVDNGIWLCAVCADLVDKDETHFPVDLLLAWKRSAEERARVTVGKPAASQFANPVVVSVNQSGGQTAHTINNYGPPPRRLVGLTIPGQLANRLRAKPVIHLNIRAYNPDGETQRLARDFFDLANQLRWQVVSLPGREICPDPLQGIHIHSTETDAADPLVVLAEWLRGIGYATIYESGAPQNLIRVAQQY